MNLKVSKASVADKNATIRLVNAKNSNILKTIYNDIIRFIMSKKQGAST